MLLLYIRVLTCFLLYSNTVRKSIARVLTVITQKQRQNLREFYKGKNYLPLDLRYKKTRAIRRRLTPVRCHVTILASTFYPSKLAWAFLENRETAEEGHPLFRKEVCCQGLRWLVARGTYGRYNLIIVSLVCQSNSKWSCTHAYDDKHYPVAFAFYGSGVRFYGIYFGFRINVINCL